MSLLTTIEQRYLFVTELVKGFQLRDQLLVLWRGSEKDEFPISSIEGMPGIIIERVTCSAHRQTQACLDQLNGILTRHLRGVIVAVVGKSNGLGPVLAGQSNLPVIALPVTGDSFPDDYWSSLRMPTGIPLMVCNNGQNAILAASRILALQNPILYARLQRALEDQIAA